MGKVGIEGMEFYAYHGYYNEEAKLGGQYSVDVQVETDFEQAAQSDELKQTVNYEKIYEIVKTEMSIRSKLIEHVGKRIATKVLASLPAGAASVKVRVTKKKPPIPGNVEKVFIELEERRHT